MTLTDEQLAQLEVEAKAQCVPLGTPVRVTPGQLAELVRHYREQPPKAQTS